MKRILSVVLLWGVTQAIMAAPRDPFGAPPTPPSPKAADPGGAAGGSQQIWQFLGTIKMGEEWVAIIRWQQHYQMTRQGERLGTSSWYLKQIKANQLEIINTQTAQHNILRLMP